MTTSGTVSQTVIDVTKIIEHAFRRAGKSPADQTPDAILAAQDCLYFYLCFLATQGTMLWTVEKELIGTVIGAGSYTLALGTLDVRKSLYRTVNLPSGGTASSDAGGNAINAFDRTLTQACTQTSTGGSIKYQFQSSTRVSNIGFMANGNQYYTLAFEYSIDNINWVPVLTLPQQEYLGGVWYYWDINTPILAPYFRVRETSNGILNVTQLAFNTILQEIEMARINIDIYTSQTNKTWLGRNQLQYWVDRQVPSPIMRMWPVSDYAFDQLVVWKKRYIQDVGSALTNTIEVPQYWIEPIITELACRLILELPGADMKRYDMLKKEAGAATYAAQQEERDNSPIQLAPNISCYTR